MVLVPNEHSGARPKLDFAGFLLSGGACIALMYGLDLAARRNTQWLTVAAFILCGAVLVVLMVRHSRRHPAPLLEFSALKIPTFAVMIWGGTLFRISIYAVPFLLPLMFQVGFGMNAFNSGLLVLAVFAGNVAMKPLTTPTIRWLGFRKTLLVNGVVVIAAVLVCAFLTPSTPRWFIIAALFVGGLCRSMQFTCLNTIGFADVPKEKLSTANTLFSAVVQVNVGMGIAIGAIALQMAVLIRGNAGTMQVADFHLAFVLVTVFAVLALYDCLRLDRHAGAVVSGHAPEPAPSEQTAAEPVSQR